MSYEQIASSLMTGCTFAPNTWPASSFPIGTMWGARINDAMCVVEREYAAALLKQLHEEQVPGAVVEFGVFEGRWLEFLMNTMDGMGMARPVLGFDSFEGLPAPTEADEGMGWAEGEYNAPLTQVSQRLRLAERPHLKLIKGWFCDTIGLPEAQVDQIAYARVDGDLYESAVDTLSYLSGKLVDGAILVFDDWTFNPEKGETKAFFEWAPTSGYTFESLGFFSIGRLYMRVSKT
ncbi:TylF/MycF/NovP-related O-methyltransferase [Caulobacter sp. DWR2-3-1b2]|uniref:TylF/MycF/NovP-related O-methyltransferase n=1 Tax=unclassified Caulobacter TaxID=2648921 RepID=UPI003CF7703C